jgi:hypothetical protein
MFDIVEILSTTQKLPLFQTALFMEPIGYCYGQGSFRELVYASLFAVVTKRFRVHSFHEPSQDLLEICRARPR